MRERNWIKRAVRTLFGNKPPDKDLIEVFGDSLSAEERGVILDRIFRDTDRTAEFSALAELNVQDKSIRNNLQELCFSPGDVEKLRKAADREIRSAGRNKEVRFRAASLLRPAAAITAGLVLILVIVQLRRPENTGDTARTGRIASFAALEPSGEIHIKNRKFRWSYVRGAKYYRLEILDFELNPVFSRDLIENEFYLPSGSDIDRLEPGKLYFWKVIAFLEGGGTIESGFQKFRISGI